MLRKKVIVLQTLWSKYCPLSDAEESRDARLHFLAQVVGHCVGSANELSEQELEKAIQALMREIQPQRHRGTDGKNVIQFPNRNGVTREQVWKIRQLEAWMEWAAVPERLEGFLRSKFHAERPEHLTHQQAWRATEALFAVAARARVKQRRSQESEVGSQEIKVSRKELTKEIRKLKEETRYWRPPAA